jgi:hypothetical protein
MAGVLLIGLVTEEKASRYMIKHNPECDLPLPVTEWPHPTQRRNGRVKLSDDREVELQKWPNPAGEVKTTEDKGYEQRTILIYTDGSKNEHGVGSGVAIFVQQELAVQLQFRLETRCSNNQAEQLAISRGIRCNRNYRHPRKPTHNRYIHRQQNYNIPATERQ